MKPLNNDNPGCNPISSNCVIWQGPDIACINLCKGDTVSDVVYNVATELCKLQDILSLADGKYDISCFNLTSCLPSDFQQLINLLIERICNLETCTGCAPNCEGTSPTPPPTPTDGCPDCEMTIAPCFEFVNGIGDTVTVLQLKDYVTAIGNKICNLIISGNLTDASVGNLGARVDTVEDQVATLEATQYVAPLITPTCVLPSVPTEMDLVLSALETQFCNLRYATGTPTDLYLNIAKQCGGLGTSPKLAPGGGPMSAIPGWTNTVDNLAQSFGNMWITICDMRAAIQNIQANCCPSGCDGISLNFVASFNSVTQYLTIYVNGTIPTNFTQCTGSTLVKVTDSAGNSVTFTYDMIANLNFLSGYSISLASTIINTTLDLTIELEPCLKDISTGTTCESCLEYMISNQPVCPNIAAVAAFDEIVYNFTSVAGNYTYTIELWNETMTSLISSQTIVSTSSVLHTGTFTGLLDGTVYKIRAKVVATGCTSCSEVICNFISQTTLTYPCLAVIDLVVTASITVEP
jgi:hypothetical protein